jgi:hypothetical protein
MDSLIDNVDRQVRSNMLDLTTCIVRLEQALSRGTLEDAKQLHLCLSRLLGYIFGKGNDLGWLELFRNDADYRALYNFLKPEGSLISFLLLHSFELTFTYELGEKDFITKTQKMLGSCENLDFEVEQVYSSRIFNLHGRHLLRVNIFEYYIFHFATAILNSQRISRPSKTSPKNRRLDLIWEDLYISSGRPVPLLSNYFWTNDESAELYFILLNQYLEFCLPIKSSSSSSLNLTNVRCIPHISQALKISEFCVGVFLEYWTNNFIAAWGEDRVRKISDGAMSLDLVKGVGDVLLHLLSFIREMRAGVTSKLNRNSNFDQAGLKLADKGLLLSYRFLKTQLQTWPYDASVAALISLWRTFLKGFEFPFLGLQVLGKKLLNHLSISLGHLANMPHAQIDWDLMGIQVSLLLQCLDGVLGKLADNLVWLQSWEEEFHEEAKNQINQFEEESFRLEPFLLREEKLPLKLGESLSNLYALVFKADFELKQRVENSSKLLSKCFLVNVDLRERTFKDKPKEISTVSSRFDLKRSIIRQSSYPYGTVAGSSLFQSLFSRFKPAIITVLFVLFLLWLFYRSPN